MVEEADRKVLLGEAEGEFVEAVEVPRGEAEGAPGEAVQVPLGETEVEVPQSEE